MTPAVNSTLPLFNGAYCWLIAKVGVPALYVDARRLFWETLPASIPDLTGYLPSIAAAVRHETDSIVLRQLASLPLPTILPPECVEWRPKLVAAWENQLKDKREWIHTYISVLRGLTRMDDCGMPPGLTCPSVLPTLLNEAGKLPERFGRMTVDSKLYGQLKCLSILSGWRPAPNVMTAPSVLKAWGDFWLELYQPEGMTATDKTRDASIIKRGIAAKALLNLTEAAGEETGLPTGLETLLLETLTGAAEFAATKNTYPLDWLNWQPQDINRFPADRLVKLPETLLKRFTLLCQQPDKWLNKQQQYQVRQDSLTWLVRWEKTGLLADGGIDLLPRIVSELNNLLNICLNNDFRSEYLLNHELCRWLVREEVANVEGGRELLQKLENHWQSRCQSKDEDWSPRLIAWDGRIQLQRAGLATETISDFQENLLEAIKKEKFAPIRVVLSIWRPGKDTPDRVWRTWERLWQKGLKSKNEEISRTAALALLRPDPADDPVDPVARRQKLRNVLSMLPDTLRPKLSVAELAGLMEMTGELPLWEEDMHTHRPWQFSTDGMKFRLPTTRTAPVSTPVTIQIVRPNPNRAG